MPVLCTSGHGFNGLVSFLFFSFRFFFRQSSELLAAFDTSTQTQLHTTLLLAINTPRLDSSNPTPWCVLHSFTTAMKPPQIMPFFASIATTLLKTYRLTTLLLSTGLVHSKETNH